MLVNHLSKGEIAVVDNKIGLIERDYMISYIAEQRKAIKEALENQVTIITGGPGTGKTTPPGQSQPHRSSPLAYPLPSSVRSPVPEPFPL